MPLLRRQPSGPLPPRESPNVSTQTSVLNPPTASMRGTGALSSIDSKVQNQQSIIQLRQRLHSKIVSDLRDSTELGNDMEVRREIERLFNRFMADEDVVLNHTERAKLQNQVVAEILGYGPI